MSNLLLRVRLEALQRNLRQVGTMVKVVKANGAAVQQLHKLLRVEGNFTWTGVVSAQLLLDNMIKLAELHPQLDHELKRHKDLAGRLTDARETLRLATKDLQKAQAILDRLVGNVDETRQLLQRQQIRATFEKELYTLLARVRTLAAKLGDDDGEALGKHWAEYSELADNASRTLFRDYVEVASGLTLRGTGLDEQFCAMADHLGDCWSTVVDLSDGFAIPAGADVEPLKRIVRFGFPEWTIWSLPLFAHVFGRLLVDDQPMFDEAIATLVAARRKAARAEAAAARQPEPGGQDFDALAARIRTYLADACATAVMGPAYACASLLLKLDPTRDSGPGEPSASDRTRSEVILATMERMGGGGVGTAMGEVATSLRTSWEALSRATAGTGSVDSASVGPLVEAAVGSLNVIRADREEPRMFGGSRHVEARRLAEALFGQAAEAPPADQPETAGTESPEAKVVAAVTPDVDLVQVLNAAWLSRLSLPSLDAMEAVELRVRTEIWPMLKPTRDAASGRQPPRGGDERNPPRG